MSLITSRGSITRRDGIQRWATSVRYTLRKVKKLRSVSSEPVAAQSLVPDWDADIFLACKCRVAAYRAVLKVHV